MKLISNDLRDGDKLPHRHVFNGMGYDGDNIFLFKQKTAYEVS